jgi:prophage DNA circulation protein
MADTKAQIVISARDDTGAALAKAKAGFASLQSEAAGVATAFAGVAAAVSGLLAASGIATLLQRTASGLDALNDLKDATGSSIENISALEDVAARTGTSFETVGQALTKFNLALKEAKPGSDIAAVLNSIGLEANNLKQLDPAEALRQTCSAGSSLQAVISRPARSASLASVGPSSSWPALLARLSHRWPLQALRST